MALIAERRAAFATMTRAQESQLRKHETWRADHLPESGFDSGEVGIDPPAFQGEWPGVDLSGKDLRRADFRRVVVMMRAKFDGADLRGARLDRVNLSGASFEGALLNGATFRNADLRDAALIDAQGLSCESMAGADLRGATLPNDVSEFKGLEAVAEASKYLQGSFRLIFALCGFSALTILSMKDENLILHNGQFTTQLPILQAVVSPLMFSYIAPLVILILYAYQVFYSLSLWRLLSFLPAYFPDGTPLDRRAHPMLINTFVRVELDRLKMEGHDIFQYVARGLIAFAGPPLTLIVFWVSCLKLHDAALSGAQSLFVACASFLFLFVMTLAGGILRGELKSRRVRFRSLFGDASSTRITLLFLSYAAITPFLRQDFFDLPVCAVLLFLIAKKYAHNIRKCRYDYAVFNLMSVGLVNFLLCLMLSFTCFAARNGSLKVIPVGDPQEVRDAGPAPSPGQEFPSPSRYLAGAIAWVDPSRDVATAGRARFPRDKVPSLFSYLLRKINYYPFLDLRGRVISRRPDGWTGLPEKESDELLTVSGADLEGTDLRSMDAERTFLTKANLRRSDLRDAYLRFANLREADLTDARLDGAYLRGANLRDAILLGADLRGAIFSTDLGDPHQRIGPNFQGAKIDRTTHFDPAAIRSERVRNFALAFFGVSDLKDWADSKNEFLQGLIRIGINPRVDEDLVRKKLPCQDFDGLAMAGADLREFDLHGSTFRGKRPGRDALMDLAGAWFTGADLSGADFTDADLTGADFCRANLSGTRFDRAKLSGAKFNESNWREATHLDEGTYSVLESSEKARSKP